MCRELEANGLIAPISHTDDFILKVTAAKVTENSNKATEKVANKLQKVTEKAQQLGDVLTENKL